MNYETYQEIRGYCWQDLSAYIDTPFNNDTLELKQFVGGKSADIEHEHSIALGLYQTKDLTPRERAAAHLLAVVSNHRAIAWHREAVTPDGSEPAAPLEQWQATELKQQTIKAISKYAVFIPEREAVALLALIQDTAPAPSTAQPEQAAATAPVVAALVEPAKTGPIFSMTQAAIIEAHAHEWPSIRADIKGAAANGLALAKAGVRGWYEDIAMDWARAKGKLIDTGKPDGLLAQAMNSMASVPGRKHTLQG